MAQISIIQLSQIEDKTRLDSEFYLPEYLHLFKLLNKINSVKLQKLRKKITVGYVGPMVSNYEDNGIILLQTQNIDEFFLNLTDQKRINKTFHEKLKKTQVHKNDILIARSGSFGKASIYLENDVINSADIILIEAGKINPFYLVCFLNSKYGAEQMFRFASGGLQGHVNLKILDDLLVPTLPAAKQNEIEEIILKSYEKLKESQTLISEAEEILLDEINFRQFIPDNQYIYTRNYSEVSQNRRIDAEYYLPHYSSIIEQIKKSSSNKFSKIIDVNDQNTTPQSEVKYRYIELANITKDGFINDYTFENGRDLPSRARRLIKTGDIIISSIEGSLSSCALVTEEYNDALCSTGFYVIHSNEINPETLLVLFKSKPIQALLKRGCSGTILAAINKEELEKIDMPPIGKSVQIEIAKKVKAAHKARLTSKQFLEDAKKKVEDAIETRAN